MTRSSSLSRRLVAVVGIAAIVAACTGSTPSASTAPSSAPSASEPGASASGGAFTGISYPESGDAPCGVAPYTGTIKKITAIDRLTVEFQLCASDVAFLPKAAFSTFGIQDSDYLAAHAKDKSYLTQPNGTGPYKLTQWDTGNRIDFEANPNYWGDAAKAPKAELRWSDTAAQRLVELESGTSIDGMDNPGRDEIAKIKTEFEPDVHAATCDEHDVHRHEPRREAVGRRERPEGHRDGHRPQAASSTTSIRKGQKSRPTSPRARRSCRSAARATAGMTSTPRPRRSC